MFRGQLFHAQHWPEALDYAGKRVVVGGVAARPRSLWCPPCLITPATLLMLQRSPTYIASVPQEDPTARVLRKFLPISWAFRLTRWEEKSFSKFTCIGSRGDDQKACAAFSLVKVREELGPRLRGCGDALHASLRPLGISACARCPTATCLPLFVRGAQKWSPIKSTISPLRRLATQVRGAP